MTDQRIPSTRNILRLFRGASDSQWQRGMTWYLDAHQTAQTLGERYDVSADAAAGIIAALSPLQSWGANKALAERFIAAGGLDSGYLTVGLNKGKRILAGEDVETVLHSQKIVNFYKGIIANGDTDAVCVDRHAAAAVYNVRFDDKTRPKIAGTRYDMIADTYRRGAKAVGIPAAKFQAVVWLAERSRWWSEGAFDGV